MLQIHWRESTPLRRYSSADIPVISHVPKIKFTLKKSQVTDGLALGLTCRVEHWSNSVTCPVTWSAISRNLPENPMNLFLLVENLKHMAQDAAVPHPQQVFMK